MQLLLLGVVLLISLLWCIANLSLRGINTLDVESKIKAQNAFDKNDPFSDKTGRTSTMVYRILKAIRLIIGIGSVVGMILILLRAIYWIYFRGV